jgi:glutathione S-transferase
VDVGFVVAAGCKLTRIDTKLKHWRGFQAKNARRSSPMLVFYHGNLTLTRVQFGSAHATASKSPFELLPETAMQLIGMLDSPYVRRVALTMKLMGIPFEHRSISVFRQVEEFSRINPLVKAPTLVCDDGTVLMDSTLIIDYLNDRVAPAQRLMPAEPQARCKALRNVGVALVACEKAVQHYYERGLRPADKQHEPWLARVDGQLKLAIEEMERIVSAAHPWLHGARLMQDDLTIAVAWRFAQFTTPDALDWSHYPKLADFSARAEAMPAFASTPLD